MVRWLLRLTKCLPRGLREQVLGYYWSAYWKTEEREERQALPGQIQAPISGSERAVLIETIADCYPFDSVLEIGCGYAQNFHILAKLFPAVRFVGIDADQQRIAAGLELLSKLGFKNTRLAAGDAFDLKEFPDNSADLVIASAMLLLVPPDRVEGVMRKMFRIARKSVIILEQHQPGPDAQQALGVPVSVTAGTPEGGSSAVAWSSGAQSSGVYYLRDYEQLFRRFACPEQVRAIKVPAPRWEIEQWKQYAYVFAVSV